MLYIKLGNLSDEPPKTLLEELTDLVEENGGDTSIRDEEPEEETFFLKDIPKLDKKKEPKKKKVKKDKSKGMVQLGLDNITIKTPQGEAELDMDHTGFLDYYLREKDDEEEDDTFVDRIVDPNRKSYQKLKKDKNKYKREVAEELTLLYDLLKETDKFSKRLTKKYEELDNGKSRSMSKYTVDLAEAVLSSKQSKLGIIREISNIKKTVADLKLKHEAQIAKFEKDNNKGDSVDQNLLASSYMQDILRYGRKNLLDDVEEAGGSLSYTKSFLEPDYDDDDEDDELREEDIPDDFTDIPDNVDPDDVLMEQRGDTMYDDIIEQRLANSGYRSAEGSAYIKYESREPKVLIRLNKDDSYSFFAVDKDGDIIDDYPLPSNNRLVNPISFSQDRKYGTDNAGRTYKVIE